MSKIMAKDIQINMTPIRFYMGGVICCKSIYYKIYLQSICKRIIADGFFCLTKSSLRYV